MKSVVIAGLLALCWQFSFAQQPTTIKRSYNLFRPVPEELMRDLSTDRPDQTESPITVDAGHFQVEADALYYTHNKIDQTTVNGYSFAAVNLKAGLTNFADLQFVLPAYTSVRSKTDDLEVTEDGFSDLITRLKVNLVGNDGGDFALGVMPVAKWPTASSGLGNDEFEWGIIVPASVSLPNEFGAGAMVGIDFLKDTDHDENYTSLLLTGVVGRGLTDALGAYLEMVGEKSSLDGAEWQAVLSTGMTYGVNADLQFDIGLLAGLTDEVDDLRIFGGVSFRH